MSLRPACLLPLALVILFTASAHSSLVARQDDSDSTSSPSPSSSSKPSSTSSSDPIVHTVSVGRGNFNYDPNVTFAKPGDVVEFQFYPTNHSVTRAEYGFPCIPYEDTGNNKVGFYSGHFVTQDFANPPKWNLTINDTLPVFYYCTAVDSCIGEGMVGVINPNDSVSLQQQKQKAEQAPYMLEPGQPFPAEGGPTAALTASAGAATYTSTAAVTAASSTAPSPSSGGSGSSGLSGGAIAGIVVGVVAFVALLAAFVWLLGRLRGAKDASNWGGTNPPRKNEQVAEWASTSGAANPSLGPWSPQRGTFDAGQQAYMFPQHSPTPTMHDTGNQSMNAAMMGMPGYHGGDGPSPGIGSEAGAMAKGHGEDKVHEVADSARYEMEASPPAQSPPMQQSKSPPPDYFGPHPAKK